MENTDIIRLLYLLLSFLSPITQCPTLAGFTITHIPPIAGSPEISSQVQDLVSYMDCRATVFPVTAVSLTLIYPQCYSQAKLPSSQFLL